MQSVYYGYDNSGVHQWGICERGICRRMFIRRGGYDGSWEMNYSPDELILPLEPAERDALLARLEGGDAVVNELALLKMCINAGALTECVGGDGTVHFCKATPIEVANDS